jgi:hypothetical protein
MVELVQSRDLQVRSLTAAMEIAESAKHELQSRVSALQLTIEEVSFRWIDVARVDLLPDPAAN